MDWNNKEEVLNQVRTYGGNLKNAAKKLQDDEEIVLEAIKHTVNASALQYASDRLKADKEFIKRALHCNPNAIVYASDEIQSDKEMLRHIIVDVVTREYLSEFLKVIAPKIANDKELIKIAVGRNGYCLQYASDELKNDKEIVNEAISYSPQAIKYASNELKNNYELAFQAVAADGRTIEYLSDRLKDDKYLALTAINDNKEAIKYVSKRLQADRDLVKFAKKNANPFLYYKIKIHILKEKYRHGLITINELKAKVAATKEEKKRDMHSWN